MGTNKLLRLIGVGGATGLGILAFILLSCPNLGNASAVGEYTGILDEADAQVQSNIVGVANKVWVKPSISIALGSTEIELDTNKAVNNFISGSVNLTVKTNSERGFKVLMYSNGSGNLVATDDPGKTIPTIGAKSTPANFPATSAWGYYADAAAPSATSEYYPTSTEATVVKETNTSTTVNNYKVGLGVKVDATTPIGNYQNQIVVSVVANPIAAFNLAHITKMQEMTPDICAATPEYVSTSNYAWKTLVDDRVDNDGNKKSYKVAKLADGNCWMVENLAYSLGKEMTSNDTDLAPGAKKTVASGWWHPNSYWYYDWNAATAGSGASAITDGAIASDSICPKGWQLPLSGVTKNAVSGSFYYLLDKYSISSSSTMASTGMSASGPLKFISTGAYSSGVSGLNSRGNYWSRVAYSGTYAYAFVWDTGDGYYNPSRDSERRTSAISIRCIARQVAR